MKKNTIGGYFELETTRGTEYHQDAIQLNTGRHSLEYILRARGYKKIYLPYYTCEVILEPINRLDVEFTYYSINEKFDPIFNFDKVGEDEVFLYTNYFGICNKKVEEVTSKDCNIIIDNAQAFYAKPANQADTFYSARKFFGVPDGAYLYTDSEYDIKLEDENSSKRFNHLLKRIEKGPEEGYKEFKENDASFKASPIKAMSQISRRILGGIEYSYVKNQRIENFQFLHDGLGGLNQLMVTLDKDEVPMVYPFLCEIEGLKEYLIEHKIYIPTYWPSILNKVEKNKVEYKLTKYLIALPIDQRLSRIEMGEIIKVLKKFMNMKSESFRK